MKVVLSTVSLSDSAEAEEVFSTALVTPAFAELIDASAVVPFEQPQQSTPSKRTQARRIDITFFIFPYLFSNCIRFSL